MNVVGQSPIGAAEPCDGLASISQESGSAADGLQGGPTDGCPQSRRPLLEVIPRRNVVEFRFSL